MFQQKKVLFLFIAAVFSPSVFAGNTFHGRPVSSVYRSILEPRSFLSETLQSTGTEFFIGCDFVSVFTRPRAGYPYDLVPAAFACDHYKMDSSGNNGIWYAGVYGRSGTFPDSLFPLTFTAGFLMNTNKPLFKSLTFDWCYFGLSDNPDEDRQYFSAGIMGFRYGIGLNGIRPEYHTWGIYDLALFTGWLTGLLKLDTVTDSLSSDLIWKDIGLAPFLKLSLAFFFQFLEDRQWNPDQWAFRPVLNFPVLKDGPVKLNILTGLEVGHRDSGRFYGGGLLGVKCLIPLSGWSLLLLQFSAGYNDSADHDRLTPDSFENDPFSFRIVCGVLFDYKEKE